MNRQERAAWRDAQKFHAEEKKRADEIRIAEIEAEAEEKKKANEIKIQKLKKEQAKLEAKNEQAKLEAYKEVKIKEMEFQDQQAKASSSPATPLHPPPP